MSKEATPAAAPAEAAAADSRFIMIKDPKTGKEVKRVDWIREQNTAGMTRGDIARKLTEIQGKKVPYQIVFAATKEIVQPKKPEKPAEVAKPAAKAGAPA